MCGFILGSGSDVGSVYNFSHTVLHKVAASHIESISKKPKSIFMNFYSLNVRFYF